MFVLYRCRQRSHLQHLVPHVARHAVLAHGARRGAAVDAEKRRLRQGSPIERAAGRSASHTRQEQVVLLSAWDQRSLTSAFLRLEWASQVLKNCVVNKLLSHTSSCGRPELWAGQQPEELWRHIPGGRSVVWAVCYDIEPLIRPIAAPAARTFLSRC